MVSFFKDAGTVPRNAFPGRHTIPINNFARPDAHLKVPCNSLTAHVRPGPLSH